MPRSITLNRRSPDVFVLDVVQFEIDPETHATIKQGQYTFFLAKPDIETLVRHGLTCLSPTGAEIASISDDDRKLLMQTGNPKLNISERL